MISVRAWSNLSGSPIVVSLNGTQKAQCTSAASQVGKGIMKLKYYLYIRQDVTTRWNSTFLMFERFLALKPALLEMQAQENYRSHHRVLSKIKCSGVIMIQDMNLGSMPFKPMVCEPFAASKKTNRKSSKLVPKT